MEEVSPWATISTIAPARLHCVWMREAAMTRPMWLTDE